MSDEELAALVHARAQIAFAFGVEEKFELLMANHKDFERDVLELALERMLNFEINWSGMAGDKLLLARRLSNLLSSARLYLDQVSHDLSSHYGSDALAAFEIDRRQEYDSSFAYRLLEALRNYVQHRNLNLLALTYPGQWIGEPPGWMRYGVYLSLETDVLINDDKFKASVAKEIAADPQLCGDLVLLVREYVEALARIHLALRSRIAPDVDAADMQVRQTIDRWLAAGEPNALALAVTSEIDPERPKLLFHITTNLIDRRLDLERQNQSLSKLSRRFVSGAPRSSRL